MRSLAHTAAVLIALALLGAAERVGQPPLVFEPAAPNFGRVTALHGADPVLLVRVKNTSGSPAHLAAISSGCGCIVVDLAAPTDLDPGESVDVQVTLRLQQMRVGRYSYEMVAWAGQDKRLGQTTVEYEFDPAVVSDVRRFFLNVSEPGGSASDSMLLKVRREGQPRLRAQASTPEVEVTLERADAPDTWKLTATARPMSQFSGEGSGRSVIDVLLGDESDPALVVAVECRVASPVALDPDVVLLGTLVPGVEHVRRVRLSVRDGYVLREIRTSSADISAAPGEDAEGGFVDVRVIPRDSAGNVMLEETVTLRFDGPHSIEKTVTIVGEWPVPTSAR